MKRQKSFEKNNPTLYLVATPIGNLKESLPQDLWYSKEADEVREHILKCKMNCRLLNCNFK